MRKYKIHLHNQSRLGLTYCGRILTSFDKPLRTIDWRKVTCKHCLKKFFKTEPYLKHVHKEGDLIILPDNRVARIIKVEIIANQPYYK